MIQQSAFAVTHAIAPVVGIVAFDAEVHTAQAAARIAWGVDATYKELDAFEMLAMTKAGVSVFCATINK